MKPVQIDTTQAATDTIQYVATDQSGLTSTSTSTSTSTRTVIVEVPAAPLSPTTPPSAATTTQATSTSP